ncbi:ABC transporter substrate-binding protein [Sphingobacterium bovistauri]|uniref:Extracellular solute-binding protein n=1 Tax=Sphingobacterium bovistauri TaxID=2781959 RepID=A0ABS7Z3J2_9SPHI|nr:extracellular solute-binding protein [Sphingobacterium bovistauri]MCA5004729.1 extracellular solute-binding protein [Sphingobacterium bovistauri]
MNSKIQLKGITWGHSRGYVPMVASAQRFEELNLGVEIIWKKRTLQEFADKSIMELAHEYDLLVIDHPWTGHASKENMLVPFDDYLSAEYMQDQKSNSVGKSYESYNFQNKQWALAIDAATPVAASRADLLEEMGLKIPESFDELIDLAKLGKVGFSLIPVDVLMSFYMFCCSLGEEPCQSKDYVISTEVGVKALKLFKALSDLVDERFYSKNPFMVYEDMVNNDDIVYCPFAYGYSNYSRHGYAKKTLTFHDLVTLTAGKPMISTLGGAGLAVSSKSKNIELAVKYAEFVASPIVQSTIYVENGGQPGHLAAWQNDVVNANSKNYFKNTLPTLQNAYLRPRYYGHLYFQDNAGDIVVDYLRYSKDEKNVLESLNKLYKESQDK